MTSPQLYDNQERLSFVLVTQGQAQPWTPSLVLPLLSLPLAGAVMGVLPWVFSLLPGR